MAVLTLDRFGVVAALVLAAFLLYFGRQVGWMFVSLMTCFLLLAFIVTYFRIGYKERKGLTERSRGIRNVLANGLAPLAFAVIFYIGAGSQLGTVALAGFIGSVAAITADKFSSELGVLDGVPREIFSLRKTRKGRSGSVTLLGLGAGLLGALLIALFGAAMLHYTQYSNLSTTYLVLGAAAGFVGTVVDSAVGHFEEIGMGNKHTSNFICSIAGGAVMAVIALLLL